MKIYSRREHSSEADEKTYPEEIAPVELKQFRNSTLHVQFSMFSVSQRTSEPSVPDMNSLNIK
jgi:hypothetical protein